MSQIIMKRKQITSTHRDLLARSFVRLFVRSEERTNEAKNNWYFPSGNQAMKMCQEKLLGKVDRLPKRHCKNKWSVCFLAKSIFDRRCKMEELFLLLLLLHCFLIIFSKFKHSTRWFFFYWLLFFLRFDWTWKETRPTKPPNITINSNRPKRT